MNDVNIPLDFEAVIRNIQAKLTPVVGLNHVDEDWGQLDDYSPNFPVQWPCALIDTPLINFSNLGMDRTQTPRNRQMSDGIVSITVANLKLNNTSGRAPKFQKDNAWSIWSLINKIHQELVFYIVLYLIAPRHH